VAGQVMDISKHETSARLPQAQRPGIPARLYRFPAGKSVLTIPPSAPPPARRSKLRLHLMVEVAIGLLIWLIWFIWHLFR
jgi:hypothetical protein